MSAKEKKTVNRVSFSLEDEYRSLLDNIAKMQRRSMTDELRVMIDRRATELGMNPVVPFDPKFSALTQATMTN